MSHIFPISSAVHTIVWDQVSSGYHFRSSQRTIGGGSEILKLKGNQKYSLLNFYLIVQSQGLLKP